MIALQALVEAVLTMAVYVAAIGVPAYVWVKWQDRRQPVTFDGAWRYCERHSYLHTAREGCRHCKGGV